MKVCLNCCKENYPGIVYINKTVWKAEAEKLKSRQN